MLTLKNLFPLYILACFVAALNAASPPVVPPNSVVNNASFATGTTPLAPGTIAAIFGSNLDDGSMNPFSSFGANGELLTTLGGASVTFNGIPASMFSAFPGQLNVQIPEGLGTATSAMVVVTVAGQSSSPQTVPLGPSSPGIFSLTQNGSGQGAVQIANTTIYAAAVGSISGSESRAVKPGEFITIYCTGLGAVSNPPAPGKPASGNPLSMTLTTPQVTIGGQPATVSFSGLSPGFVGLYQVNVQIPADAPGGNAVTVKLSIGGTQSNTVTIAIAGIVGSKIAGGEHHTCAVTGAGTVMCWGKNVYGQLGNGTTTKSLTPVPVSGLTGVVAITAGQDFNCALTHAGTVMCWGVNTSGNLGNRTTKDSDIPVQVLDPAGTAPLSGVAAISAGQYHVCALTSTGTVLCWGDDAEGELGPEQNTFRSGLPYQVTGIPADIAAISAGSYFTCAATSTGKAFCWGTNLSGVLGAGIGPIGPSPVAVLDSSGKSPLSGVATIADGFYNACALTNSGTVLCWGDNSGGQLGNGTDTGSGVSPSGFPVQVLDLTGKSPLSGIVKVTTGEYDSCALTSAGAALCWGGSNFGEIGDGTNRQADIPVQVSGLSSGVIDIASGYHHNCAIITDGGVQCWGFNNNGQIGNGTTNQASTPVPVVGVGGTGLLKLF